MQQVWSWWKVLVTLSITVITLAALPAAQAQQSFAHGAVVALQGTPHLWIADAQGVLHWGGDTRALAGKHVNWGDRTEVSLARLRVLAVGDPWLSAGLLKDGDPIYLVKWESDWEQPQLLHIQSIAEVELFGINGSNYGNFVLDKATWGQRFGMSAAGLQRGVLASAVPPAATPTPTCPEELTNTPLHQAVREENAEAVKLLANQRPDDLNVIIKWRSGGTFSFSASYYCDTPLSLAVKFDNSEIVRILVEAGADTNVILETHSGGSGLGAITLNSPSYYYNTPLSLAVISAAKSGNSEIVQMLVDAGADPDARITNNIPILYIAIRKDNTEVVRILIGAGGDVNARMPNGTSMLQEARRLGHTEIERLLIEAGAKD